MGAEQWASRGAPPGARAPAGVGLSQGDGWGWVRVRGPQRRGPGTGPLPRAHSSGSSERSRAASPDPRALPSVHRGIRVCLLRRSVQGFERQREVPFPAVHSDHGESNADRSRHHPAGQARDPETARRGVPGSAGRPDGCRLEKDDGSGRGGEVMPQGIDGRTCRVTRARLTHVGLRSPFPAPRGPCGPGCRGKTAFAGTARLAPTRLHGR